MNAYPGVLFLFAGVVAGVTALLFVVVWLERWASGPVLPVASDATPADIEDDTCACGGPLPAQA